MSTNLVDKAQSVIQGLIHEDSRGNSVIALKTNQIRKFLSAVTTLTNKVKHYKMRNPNEKELPEELAAQVQYLRVKMAYQAGRDKAVKEFVEKAQLDVAICSIKNSIETYEKFARYMEALVAYHKYYGGKD
jgi:CRISPR-associated protein, csm2 family